MNNEKNTIYNDCSLGVCKNHIWGTMVGKLVVNERNRDFMIFRTIDAHLFYVLPNRTCSTIALW